jgi:hypothetical protein
MMVVLTQRTLDAVTTHIANNLFPYMTVGKGDNPITLESTDLETPVQIGNSDRNKVSNSTTITDNFFVKEFKLTAPEPDIQPVNLSEVGIQSGLNVTDKLAAGFVFLASTKDNASQWTARMQGKVIEGA